MIFTIPTLENNYSYIISDYFGVIIVDPGEADPIIDFLQSRNLIPTGIFLTHNHWDHNSGVPQLQNKYPGIILNPSIEEIEVIKTPGHTKDSKCLYIKNMSAIFTGDTLFTGLCGRVIDGTMEEMHKSLQTIIELPESTNVYPGHEYLDYAIEFIDSINLDHAFYSSLLSYKYPSLNTTIGNESKNNPFLTKVLDDFIELRALKGL